MPDFIIYTAILGEYDYPPDVLKVDPKIHYVCFTDSHFFAAYHYPWEMVSISNYFHDKKITIGYLKSNSDLLFGNDVISVWVNSNLKHLNIDSEYISNVIQKKAVATPPYLTSKTIAAEAEVSIALKLEDSGIARRHIQQIKDDGFLDDQGLSATMFVIRDHRNIYVQKANALWWSIIASGVRRDELSFNYTLWKCGLTWAKLDINWCIPNALFTRVEHKDARSRTFPKDASTQNGSGPMLEMPHLPENYPKNISYIQENWSINELATIRELNTIISQSNTHGRVEGNYCYFHNTMLTPYTPPDLRRSWKREYLRCAVRGCRKGIEVGFNGGHSATILLNSEPLFSLTSVDLGEHQYSRTCADFLSKKYGERFKCIWGDSKSRLPKIDASGVDFVHIDGGHDPESALFDLDWFARMAPIDCLLLIDDVYASHIHQFANNMIQKGILLRLDPKIPSSGENALFIKKKSQTIKC